MKQHNNLMNINMYDALIRAGIKEKDARAAAIEAARGDMRLIAVKDELKDLRSHMDQSMANLALKISKSDNKLIYTMLTIAGVCLTVAKFVL